MSRAKEAEELLSAAQADARLRDELRAAYRGRHDVLDALWWAAHPLTISPWRHADPAAELASLQAAVFSRDIETEPQIEVTYVDTGYRVQMTKPEHLLRVLTAELAEDAAALDAVLARFSGRADAGHQIESDDTAVESTADAETEAGQTGRDDERVVDAAGVDEKPPASRRRRWRPITTLALVIGAFGGALVGAVAGLSLGNAMHQDTQTHPAAENLFAAFDESTSAPSVDSGSSALQIFDEPAGLPGGEVLNLGRGFVNESIRSVFGTVREPGGYGVYAVQRETDDYCLVILDGYQGVNSACASLRVLQKNGLWLLSRIVAKFPNGDNPHSPQFVDVIVRWAPDGSFSQHAVPAH